MLNKLAVVTGASFGIGRAAALNFAKQGYNVALLARSLQELLSLAKEIQLKYQVQATAYKVDIADYNAVQESINSIINNNKTIDLLFNNAGILVPGFLDIEHNALLKQFETNLFGPYYMLQTIVPVMKKQRSGYIFNIASQSGKRANPKMAAYASSKFGLLALNEALYQELLPYNVKVTALCPSAIDTAMTESFSYKNKDKIPVADVIHTVNYLLELGYNTAIKEVCLDCRRVMLDKIG